MLPIGRLFKAWPTRYQQCLRWSCLGVCLIWDLDPIYMFTSRCKNKTLSYSCLQADIKSYFARGNFYNLSVLFHYVFTMFYMPDVNSGGGSPSLFTDGCQKWWLLTICLHMAVTKIVALASPPQPVLVWGRWVSFGQ